MHKSFKNLELFELEKLLKKYKSLANSFDYLKISIASPNQIRAWSQRILPNGEIIGEMFNGETINVKTKLPITDGLFCQKLFGPINDWKCACGKYKGILVGKICEYCKTQLTESRVRRYHMGYVSLPAPVAHFWYFHGIQSYLYYFLTLAEPLFTNKDVKKLIYFQIDDYKLSKYRLIKKKKLVKNKKINEVEINGSEIILNYLESLSQNFEEKINFLRENSNGEAINFSAMRILESFVATKSKPEWMILTNLPVLPPTLRPLVEIEKNKFASSDLNELYRILLYRIHRYKVLKKKYDFSAKTTFPEFSVKNLACQDKKLIQQSVDSLIDNARTTKDSACMINNRVLKSLTETLEGKYGRFRATLLGKRVDYSGRSVIIVEPDLHLNEFGLPYKMGIELFKPFLISLFLKTSLKDFIDKPKYLPLVLSQNKLFVWKLLEKLAFNYYFLINRAPTLHKFGIQAFLPIIIPTKAIQLHPLVCGGFNADFDGDQVALHLPLYNITQLEAKGIMRPSFNLFTSANGSLILKPSQDIVIGCYYLSLFLQQNFQQKQTWFANESSVINAFEQKKIHLHEPIFCRYKFSNLKIKINEKKLYIYVSKLLEQEIKILKIYKNKKNNYLFITNLGVILGKLIKNKKFEFSYIFIKTTPGRILFNNIFKNF